MRFIDFMIMLQHVDSDGYSKMLYVVITVIRGSKSRFIDLMIRLPVSSSRTVQTHYQKNSEPMSRPITTLGLYPVSK